MTRSRLLDLYSPYTGMISYVSEAEASMAEPAISVVVSSSADTRQYGLDRVAGNGSGAGFTFDQALNAALGEGLERYAFLLRFPEHLRIGSYADLRREGRNPVSPTELPLFDESQYHRIPFARFDETTVVAWVAGNELETRKERDVPACLVYLPYQPVAKKRGERLIGVGMSTGAACATSVDEALVKGICEVVERDAFIIVWRNRLPCPEIRIDEKSMVHRTYRRIFEQRGLEYRLFLTTLDIDIPSVLGVLFNHRREPVSTIVAGAASLYLEDAILKTLRELVQGLRWTAYIDPNKARPVERFEDVRAFKDRMHLFAFSDMRPHLDFLAKGGEANLSDLVSREAKGNSAMLQKCIEAMSARGLAPIGVNLTPPEARPLGLVVCKVIVPGMEIMEADHRMPFLGPQRWRNVPVAIGRRQEPADRINPTPHPYP